MADRKLQPLVVVVRTVVVDVVASSAADSNFLVAFVAVGENQQEAFAAEVGNLLDPSAAVADNRNLERILDSVEAFLAFELVDNLLEDNRAFHLVVGNHHRNSGVLLAFENILRRLVVGKACHLADSQDSAGLDIDLEGSRKLNFVISTFPLITLTVLTILTHVWIHFVTI